MANESHRGVSISWLLAYLERQIKEVKGSDMPFFGKNFYWLMQARGGILDQTKSLNGRPCSLWESSLVPAREKGPPKLFISHTWGHPLGHICDLLKEYAVALAPSTKVWIDVVVYNQHVMHSWNSSTSKWEPVAQGLPEAVVQGMFDTVRNTERTLFFMDPSGTALNRIWCLYEIWQTQKAKSAELLEVLTDNQGVVNLRTTYMGINSEFADASNPDDRAKILAYINADMGTKALNKLIRESIKHSVDLEVQRERQLGATRTTALASALIKSAVIYWSLGDVARAKQEARESYDLRKKAHGEVHKDTAFSLAIIGGILSQSTAPADAKEALVVQQQALSVERQLDAARSPTRKHDHDLAVALNNVAVALVRAKRPTPNDPVPRAVMDQAVALLTEAVEVYDSCEVGGAYSEGRRALERAMSVCQLATYKLEDGLPSIGMSNPAALVSFMDGLFGMCDKAVREAEDAMTPKNGQGVPLSAQPMDSLDLAGVYMLHAKVCIMAMKSQPALEAAEKAIAMARRVGGPKHHIVTGAVSLATQVRRMAGMMRYDYDAFVRNALRHSRHQSHVVGGPGCKADCECVVM